MDDSLVKYAFAQRLKKNMLINVVQLLNIGGRNRQIGIFTLDTSEHVKVTSLSM